MNLNEEMNLKNNPDFLKTFIYTIFILIWNGAIINFLL